MARKQFTKICPACSGQFQTRMGQQRCCSKRCGQLARVPRERKSVEARLLAQSIAVESGCLLWTGCVDKDGYGKIQVDGRSRRTHCVAWEEKNGPIPIGKNVLHRCDRPPCILDSHLFLGTQSENVVDKIAKGRQARNRGELAGSVKLTSEQVLRIRADKRSQSDISKDHGISRSTVSDVMRRKSWVHLDAPA